MKPYFTDENVTIYNGDCQEVLDSLSPVDITVTSPPYNTLPTAHKPSGLHAERVTGVNKWIAKSASGYFDSRPEGAYQEWLNGIIGKCMNLSRGLVWLNHKVRYREGVAIHPLRFIHFPCYAEVIWDRGGSMALNCKRYAPSHEGLWAFGVPHYWDDCLNMRMSVWRLSAQRSDDHPCPFPIELVSPLIMSSCPIGGVVLDPFMGTGTALVAAKRLGRKAIGIERETRYCDLAIENLAQSVLPLFGAQEIVESATTANNTPMAGETLQICEAQTSP